MQRIRWKMIPVSLYCKMWVPERGTEYIRSIIGLASPHCWAHVIPIQYIKTSPRDSYTHVSNSNNDIGPSCVTNCLIIIITFSINLDRPSAFVHKSYAAKRNLSDGRAHTNTVKDYTQWMNWTSLGLLYWAATSLCIGQCHADNCACSQTQILSDLDECIGQCWMYIYIYIYIYILLAGNNHLPSNDELKLLSRND